MLFRFFGEEVIYMTLKDLEIVSNELILVREHNETLLKLNSLLTEKCAREIEKNKKLKKELELYKGNYESCLEALAECDPKLKEYLESINK